MTDILNSMLADGKFVRYRLLPSDAWLETMVSIRKCLRAKGE